MSFDYQPMLNGNLVKIRPLWREDYTELFAVASDKYIWIQHPSKNRYEEVSFRTFFNMAIKSGGALIVIDNETKKPIGSSRFHGYDKVKGEVEIGWTFLAKRYWGGIYNKEIKYLMLKHAFKFVHCVVFLVAPQNFRSQRAMEKIGAIHSGHRLDGADELNYVYKIMKTDFVVI